MKSFILLSYFLLLLCDLHGEVLRCDAFSRSNNLISPLPTRRGSRFITSSFLNAENKEETTEKKEKPKGSERITLYELAEMEARASKRINDRLLLPYRLGEALTNAAWFLVIFGVFLNGYGYAYIRGENGLITIGTLEERNFQLEMAKSTREAIEKSVDDATRSQIQVDVSELQQ